MKRRCRKITIEIRKPELEALIRERMERDGYANVEDALLQALETSWLLDQRRL